MASYMSSNLHPPPPPRQKNIQHWKPLSLSLVRSTCGHGNVHWLIQNIPYSLWSKDPVIESAFVLPSWIFSQLLCHETRPHCTKQYSLSLTVGTWGLAGYNCVIFCSRCIKECTDIANTFVTLGWESLLATDYRRFFLTNNRQVINFLSSSWPKTSSKI